MRTVGRGRVTSLRVWISSNNSPRHFGRDEIKTDAKTERPEVNRASAEFNRESQHLHGPGGFSASDAKWRKQRRGDFP